MMIATVINTLLFLRWRVICFISLLGFWFPTTLFAASPAQTTITAASLQQLSAATDRQAQVSLHPATGVARFVRIPADSLQRPWVGAAAEEQAAAFLREFGALFGLNNPAAELILAERETDALGMTHLHYIQQYQGVPVFASTLRFHFADDGQLRAINGMVLPALALDVTPTLSVDTAREIALRHITLMTSIAPAELTATSQGLAILRAGLWQGLPGTDHLVYEIVVEADATLREHVFVDAHTGKIVEQFSGIHTALDRRVYHNASFFDPTLLVWSEGDPLPYTSAERTAQSDINKLIEYTEDSYNFFASLSGGNFLSWNGLDSPMSILYEGPQLFCPNATWNGQSTNFCRHVVSDDLVAHEWAHGYSQSTHGLIYRWQPGALNESYSDIWGETVDLLNGGGNDAPNAPRTADACTSFTHPTGTDNSLRWLLTEDARGLGLALRDMWNPNCFGDPGKVSDSNYFCDASDNGGVHSNSGVPNHAFALLVDGGTYNGQTINGIGLTRATNLYWRTQTVYQTRTSDFADHADALEQACSDLIGKPLFAPSTERATATVASEQITAAHCAEVSKAIAAVELRLEPTQCRFPPTLQENPPLLCLSDQGPQTTLLFETWESGLDKWTIGTREVLSPTHFSTPDWAIVSDLPDERGGSAAFVANLDIGNAQLDNQTGVLYLESPPITLPTDALAPRLAFDHWFATEDLRDGGNLKISVNDGPWTLLPSSAFTFNRYNSFIITTTGTESAFTGTTYGTFDDGAWGQSQLRLGDFAQPGDTIRLRFEFMVNHSGGVKGWYVDDVQAYYCQSCGNGQLDEGEQCDDGNRRNGDGCSSTCQLEPGWFCKAPVTALGSRPAEPSVCVNLNTAACVTVNQAIPDNNLRGLSSRLSLNLNSDQVITDLDVYVEAEHTWIGDLSFSLRKMESGHQATLLDRPGSSIPGAFGCEGDDLAALFDDESVLPAEFVCDTQNVPAIAGNFLTTDGQGRGLSVFDGDLLAGEWLLSVVDHATDEVGTLQRWCLVPTTEQAVTVESSLLLPLIGR